MLTVDLANVNLLSLTGRDTCLKRIASTGGGEYAGPCPFCGGRDRFRVWPEDGDRGRWWCRQCQRHGDAIDYARERGALSFREACEQLGTATTAAHSESGAGHGDGKRQSLPDTEPPCRAWQSKARAFSEWCTRQLWGAPGADALAYLRGRGLHDATIRAAGLGYNPRTWRRLAAEWGLGGDAIRLAAGIVIPHEADGALWAVKIRLLEPVHSDGRAVKYVGVRGGRAALYGADTLAGSRTAAALTEGEFDCLLLRQQAGSMVDVATLTGAAHSLTPRWMAKLLPYRRILAAYDADAAGAAGAARLAALSRRVTAIRPPTGKDIGEFYTAGGDLGAWIAYHLAAAELRGG